MATRPVTLITDNTPAAEPDPDLLPIPGDTFAVREELKALGAVWNAAERVWGIAPEKLPLAVAIVENRHLAPPPAAATTNTDEIADPFEEDSGPSRLVALGKNDGDTYAARDALKAINANWDKERRAWMVREDRAEYARAIVAAVSQASGAAVAAVSEPSPEPPRPERARPRTPTPAPPEPLPAPVAEAVPAASFERIKMTGLWLNKSSDGQTYLAGRLSPTLKLLIFKNHYKKEGDNQPTHFMYLAPAEPVSPPPHRTEE